MNEKSGEVFSIAKDNEVINGCTISKEVYHEENTITYYSLAKKTDISKEIHPCYKFMIVASGQCEVYGDKDCHTLRVGEAIVTPVDEPVGIRTDMSVIYTELTIRRNDQMNEAIKVGEVFKLAELLPYQEGKIINMDVVHNEKMKFVIMSFDEGTGLSEHAAPGEALIFGLEGEGIIGYEGKEHTIKAGENFKFEAGGKHYVKAVSPFKMALLLTL